MNWQVGNDGLMTSGNFTIVMINFTRQNNGFGENAQMKYVSGVFLKGRSLEGVFIKLMIYDKRKHCASQ
jgi:hypothetical protein